MVKTILVTGSTDGIGRLAALKLAEAGHVVLVHGRTAEKVQSVVAEIRAQTGNGGVQGFVADLSDLVAVRGFAAEVMSAVSALDVLINNAGVFKSSIQRNSDGFDIRMAVNYLAPYVLTQELLPLLQQSAGSRVINLSSAAQASVAEEVLRGVEQVSDREGYAQSKLALTMWSFYFARQMPGLSVIAVNPGSLLNTNMVREAFGGHRASADVGGDILYDLAVAEQYEHITGKYFDNDKGDFGEAHADAYDTEKINQLIKVTEDLVS